MKRPILKAMSAWAFALVAGTGCIALGLLVSPWVIMSFAFGMMTTLVLIDALYYTYYTMWLKRKRQFGRIGDDEKNGQEKQEE